MKDSISFWVRSFSLPWANLLPFPLCFLDSLWSFTLWTLLGFFINKVLVMLLLVFLLRRGSCRKEVTTHPQWQKHT